MLDDRFGPGLVSLSPDNKSRKCLNLFIKYLIVNIKSGQVKFVSVILSDAPLKIKMNEELRKTTNKNKIINIKNGILNDFLSGMIVKGLILMFGSFLQDRILRL